jgi:hypothetical protein
MWWGAWMLACTPDQAKKPSATGPAATAHAATHSLVEVTVTPARPSDKPFRWGAEVAGLATVLVESGLSELPDVAATVEGVAPAPGLARPLRTGVAPWTARLEMGDDPALLRFQLEVCDGTGHCLAQQATGSRDRVVEPIADLLGWAAAVLGRPPTDAERAVWTAPISGDPYAVLVCGRSAATWYGILPPVAMEKLGDRNADPIAKAVWLDPGMGLAEWVLGRRESARGEWGSARVAFTGATLGRPGSTAFLADEAAALAASGRAEAATVAWSTLQEAWPLDPRFQLPLAVAASDSGQPLIAARVVQALDPRFLDEPAVVELAVRIADATGPDADYDHLLERWADAYPHEPEPVRRRVALRVRAGRLEEAWDLLPELAARGAGPEAARARMAIGVGIHRYDEAAAAADAVGETAVATRILTRKALAADDHTVPIGLTSIDDPRARQVESVVRLRGGDAEGALAAADDALAAAPFLPEALAARADALRALGRTADADATEAALHLSDPDFDRGTR